jgi:hypothetical protein
LTGYLGALSCKNAARPVFRQISRFFEFFFRKSTRDSIYVGDSVIYVYLKDSVYIKDSVRVIDTVYVSDGTVIQVHDTTKITDTLRIKDTVTIRIKDTLRIRDTVKVTPSIAESAPQARYMYTDVLDEDAVEIEISFHLDKCRMFALRVRFNNALYYEDDDFPSQTGSFQHYMECIRPTGSRNDWYTFEARCVSPEISKWSAESNFVISSKRQ